MRSIALVALVVLTIAACGEERAGSDDTSPPESTPATLPPDTDPMETPSTREPATPVSSTPLNTLPRPVTGEAPAELMTELMTDASDHFGVPDSDLEVVRGQQIEWPDGSLGCPERGVMYTQAVVPGYWVVIAHDDQQRDYRVDDRGNWRVCEGGLGGPPYN